MPGVCLQSLNPAGVYLIFRRHNARIRRMNLHRDPNREMDFSKRREVDLNRSIMEQHVET